MEARSRDKERRCRCGVCGKVLKTEGGKRSHERDVHGMHGGRRGTGGGRGKG